MPTGRPRSGNSASAARPPAARAVDVERRERADLALARGDRFGATVDDRARRQLAGLDPAGKVERGEHQVVCSGVFKEGMTDFKADHRGSTLLGSFPRWSCRCERGKDVPDCFCDV